MRAAILVLAAMAVACGSKRFVAEEEVDAGPSCEPYCDPMTNDGAIVPACENLKCQQVKCADGSSTRVTGRVYDPAGKNPLYNVVVYVPNAALDPIPHGPVCDSCGGANLTGKPIVTALTDPTGKFVLDDVPAGSNIPIVVQAGKWRRTMTLPSVQKCADNAILDTGVPDTRLRLPRHQNEFGGAKSGTSMPLIALTGGCDPVHVLLKKIGIDASELTNRNGSGTVHAYKGVPAYGLPPPDGSVSDATDAYTFWGNKQEVFRYDMIINECECAPHARDTFGPAYDNIAAFLDAGGRVFNTHYHLNFFGPDVTNNGKAAQSLQQAATWTLWGGSYSPAPFLVDTTFPKGKAMDDWLENLKSASAWPNIKSTPKGQIQTDTSGDIQATKTGVSQRWIYSQAGNNVVYASINTPTNVAPDKRCGRAIANDIHVGNGFLTTMTEQEAALEFMFFDLAACVIADDTPPAPPPPN